MPHFEAAQVRHQGLQLLIVPMNPSFGRMTPEEQNQLINELQIRAAEAQLPGAVVPVWEGCGGRMEFLAPANWRPFFEGLTLAGVLELVNGVLSW